MNATSRWRALERACLCGFTLLLICASISSCATDRRQQRRHLLKKELLSASVETYWHSLRWEYFDKAVAFVAEGPDRTALWECFLGAKDRVSVSDYTIYSVALEPDDETRATVHVQYELFVRREGAVRSLRATQKWRFEERNQWLLELTEEELGRLDVEE